MHPVRMEPKYALGLRDLNREFGETALGVEGELPDWLDGTLLCNGPGRFTVTDDQSVNHWFDGLALLRRFRIDGDSDYVSFAARFLRSEEFAAVETDGRLAREQFGTDPYEDTFERLGRVLSPKLTDNASVGFEAVGGTIRAVTETPRGVVFDPDTLDTGPTVDRTGDLDVTTVLGHVHRDHRQGELLAVGTRLGWTSEYLLLRRDADESTFEKFGGIERERPAYLHSFAVTDGFVILLESPFRIEPLDLLDEGPLGDAFEWTDTDTRLLVFDRDTGTHVATATTDPCFTFHHVNAFERSGDVTASDRTAVDLTVDLVAYDDAEIIRALSLDRLRDPDAMIPGGELRRYELTVPVQSDGGADADADVRYRSLSPEPIEFPTINYKRANANPYRYVYAAGNGRRPAESLPDRLCKIDLESGSTSVWREEGCFPGEPVFVPREADGTEHNGEGAPAEDDGVVLSVVLDTDHPAPVDESGARSVLLVLDGESFAERARAPLPCVLPFGFHGQFFAEGEPEGEFARSMA